MIIGSFLLNRSLSTSIWKTLTAQTEWCDISMLHMNAFSCLLHPCQLVNYAYRHNIASVYPEPKDKEAFVMSHIYSPDYDSFTLDTYAWPQEAMNVQDVWYCWPLVKLNRLLQSPFLPFCFVLLVCCWFFYNFALYIFFKIPVSLLCFELEAIWLRCRLFLVFCFLF